MAEDSPFKELKIKVDTSGMQAIMQNLEEKKQESEQLKREKEALEKQILDATSRENQLKEDLNKATGGGEGTVPMSDSMVTQEKGQKNAKGQREFSSKEDLYAYAKLHDKKAYAELQRKSFDAVANSHMPFEFTDTLDKTDENNGCRSIIGRMLDRQNKALRESKGVKE